MSQNRTKWPIKGGAVSVQPGWFPGHKMAQFYINLGYGNEPLNYSHNMVNSFAIVGPTNVQYDGTFCLPQVPLPADFNPKVGDNATIQVIELAQHGAALYNCVDITFAEPHEVNEVNNTNCFNSTQPNGQKIIDFQMVFSSTSSPAPHNAVVNPYTSILAPLFVAAAASLAWL